MVQIKMTIDECLEFADEWSRGMTFYEGSQGWRVVCMLLAEEVRRLRCSMESAQIKRLNKELHSAKQDANGARECHAQDAVKLAWWQDLFQVMSRAEVLRLAGKTPNAGVTGSGEKI